jgi:hypothetical protein
MDFWNGLLSSQEQNILLVLLDKVKKNNTAENISNILNEYNKIDKRITISILFLLTDMNMEFTCHINMFSYTEEKGIEINGKYYTYDGLKNDWEKHHPDPFYLQKIVESNINILFKKLNVLSFDHKNDTIIDSDNNIYNILTTNNNHSIELIYFFIKMNGDYTSLNFLKIADIKITKDIGCVRSIYHRGTDRVVQKNIIMSMINLMDDKFSLIYKNKQFGDGFFRGFFLDPTIGFNPSSSPLIAIYNLTDFFIDDDNIYSLFAVETELNEIKIISNWVSDNFLLNDNSFFKFLIHYKYSVSNYFNDTRKYSHFGLDPIPTSLNDLANYSYTVFFLMLAIIYNPKIKRTNTLEIRNISFIIDIIKGSIEEIRHFNRCHLRFFDGGLNILIEDYDINIYIEYNNASQKNLYARSYEKFIDIYLNKSIKIRNYFPFNPNSDLYTIIDHFYNRKYKASDVLDTKKVEEMLPVGAELQPCKNIYFIQLMHILINHKIIDNLFEEKDVEFNVGGFTGNRYKIKDGKEVKSHVFLGDILDFPVSYNGNIYIYMSRSTEPPYKIDKIIKLPDEKDDKVSVDLAYCVYFLHNLSKSLI